MTNTVRYRRGARNPNSVKHSTEYAGLKTLTRLSLLGMPHPRRLDQAAIIDTARAMLEESGPDALSMRSLARELGVRAPSLYAYVESRDDLFLQLMIAGLHDLRARLDAAEADGDDHPTARLERLATAYIIFAETNPRLFNLVFSARTPARQPPPTVERETSRPVVQAAIDLAGERQGPIIAQSIWSLVHGYTTLHLAGLFSLNEDPRAAFREGLDTLLTGAVAGHRPGA